MPLFPLISDRNQFFQKLRGGKEVTIRKFTGINGLQNFFYKMTLEVYPDLRGKRNGYIRGQISGIYTKEDKELFRTLLARQLTSERLLEHLSKNTLYADVAAAKREELLATEELASFIEEGMPADYTRLYPRARRMKREFILHLGPTNSGKTHDAMQDLIRAKSGVYLAPLRLMAYEQYETMTEAGVNCRMLTGEEDYGDKEAAHVSSTVEMADYLAVYEVAVVDEAQMMADPDRGYAWTAAILGIRADRIHICAAPYAADAVTKLVELCGDSLRVEWHDRLVPIRLVPEPVSFPDGVERGDALIVFSRRSVHAIAGVLNQKGHSCSIIYGALPYDVRHEEVRKFRDGETDVVVATDAIGMGMNLPVRRVVFIEEYKFDGTISRPLLPEEVQQIAGRAGRYGIYDLGLYGGTEHPGELGWKYDQQVPPIREAVINIPRDIFRFDIKLSLILQKWSEMPVQPGFIKANVAREITLAQILEKESDDRELIYDFISLKFDEESPQLLKLWQACFRSIARGEGLEYIILEDPMYMRDMSELELLYRQYDLLYSCIKRFEPESDRGKEMDTARAEISERLITLLKDQKYESRKCKRCGKALPFGYRYNVCDRCFRQRRWQGRH